MTNLQILNNSIRTFENLYSLNDLHKASGENPNQRPNQFIRLDQTQELIAELIRSPNLGIENSDAQICASTRSFRNGINKGTWACEELVLAYATWISPKFHLIVLRAFLAMHRGEQLQPQQLSLPEPDYNLVSIQNSEQTLAMVIKLYSYCLQAYEMQEKLNLHHRGIAKEIEQSIGGHYLHNFKYPLEQTMAKAKSYVQSNVERLAMVKAVNNLLN